MTQNKSDRLVICIWIPLLLAVFCKELTKLRHISISSIISMTMRMISSISYSDGVVEIPEDVSFIKKGDLFDYYDFDKLFF